MIDRQDRRVRWRRALTSPVEREYFAACARGLEEALETELRDLGARGIEPRRGGVAFSGDVEAGYRAALWLRSAVRVQELLLRTPAPDRKTFHRAVAALPWERHLRVDQTLAV